MVSECSRVSGKSKGSPENSAAESLLDPCVAIRTQAALASPGAHPRPTEDHPAFNTTPRGAAALASLNLLPVTPTVGFLTTLGPGLC